MSDELYQLDIGHPEYCASLREVRAELEQNIEPYLERDLFWVLKRAPYEGHSHPESGIYWLRRWILKPVTMVIVAYRIDERRKVVTLLKIRRVDTTRL